jgi:peptidoglycan/LPS O-acetylase OafA/YrhL
MSAANTVALGGLVDTTGQTKGAMSNSSSNLDQLRAIAVVTVMVDHLIPTMVHTGFPVSATVRGFTENIGHAGVLAFFVHTSLVLMQSLARMEAQQPSRLALRFYLRRWFRIYPLAIAVIAGVVLFHLPDATWRPAIPPYPKEIIANLFLAQNLVTGQSVLVPLWSLPYEVEMYLVLPLAYVLARHSRAVPLVAATLLLSYVSAYVLFKLDGGHMNLAGYVPCFLAGVLCFALRTHLRPMFPGGTWALYVLGIVAGYCYGQLDVGVLLYWLGWLFALILGLSINLFHDCEVRWLNRLCFQIATYSYGLYLLHVPALYLVFIVWRPASITVALVSFFALASAAAVLAYHLIEAPMVSLGRRLTEGRAASLGARG